MGPDLLATLVHADDARRFSEVQLPKILAAGDDDTFVNLYRMKHRSGEWRWFRAHERIFSRTPSGTPTQMVGTAHDVTAERETGQALALATTAVTAAANGIVVTDVNATIQWANPAFCAMTGYRHDEVVGCRPSMLKSGLQDDAFYRDLWQTILDGRVWRGQLVNRRRDGSRSRRGDDHHACRGWRRAHHPLRGRQERRDPRAAAGAAAARRGTHGGRRAAGQRRRP